MVRCEKGHIVVEFTISFMLFILMCWAFLAMINVTALQSRVHFALTQTAIEISMYAYIIEALGFTDNIESWSEGHAATNELINNMGTLISDVKMDPVGATPGTVEDIIDIAETIADDPKKFLTDILKYAAVDLSHETLIRPIFNKNMGGRENANVFLQRNKVEGDTSLLSGFLNTHMVSFDESYLIRDGNTVIRATYEVDFTFGMLPFTNLKISQTAMTRAWLGGNDRTKRKS